MRYFDDFRDEWFERRPEAFDESALGRIELGYAMGATMYCPATKEVDLLKTYRRGCRTLVIDTEDAVTDDELPEAEEMLHRTLVRVHDYHASLPDLSESRIPMVMVRVRLGNFERLLEANEGLWADTVGVMLPKFDRDYIEYGRIIASEAFRRSGVRWVHPILETEAMFPSRRWTSLRDIDVFLNRRVSDGPGASSLESMIPTIRMGAADFCGRLGVRRPEDFTAYDNRTLGNIIGDVSAMFGCTLERNDYDPRFIVSGTVWEHFPSGAMGDKGYGNRLQKPKLRQSVFDDIVARERLLNQNKDMLLEELSLDKLNGLQGKTVIHPSHCNIVNIMYAPTFEEWSDASAIQSHRNGGALKSADGGRMNEPKPHWAWSKRIMNRARFYGVLAEGVTVPDIIEGERLYELRG